MITSLSIENFALIDKLAISFSGGFSTITGETGAGKSILLGALGLALGKRADLSSLKNKTEKCIIEAVFRISQYNLQSFFESAGLDYDDETIIRREILPSGKSRAFVNDTPVNLQELHELGNYLIDIHSQNETHELAGENYQFRIIDAISGNASVLNDFRELLRNYKELNSLAGELKIKLQNSQKEQDYNTFLLDELLAANLKAGEKEELETEFSKLSNVGIIREQFEKAMTLANEEQVGILQNLREFRSALQKISGISAEYHELSERAGSVLVEFDDIMSELEIAGEKLSGDPERLEFVNQRLQLISTLQKKHVANSLEELIEIRDNLDEKIVSASELESEIEKTNIEIAALANILDAAAAQIHQNRIKAVPILTKKLLSILGNLGMPHAKFNIEITQQPMYFSNGKDELQFLFAANKGSDFGLLKKVASGGEMSRIMLAVKSVLAQYSKLPTIIFDEIDTGVSGEIANRMGDIMKEMSESMQVFSITHLPQIAAKGSAHFRVFKSVAEGRTNSGISLLSQDERVDEIAKMLSGSNVSESAINHARALLN